MGEVKQHGHADHADEVQVEDLELALSHAVREETPPPEVKERLMSRIRALQSALAKPPKGFSFVLNSDEGWEPHPVPGIRMKLLAVNRKSRYVTLLLDVQPGARYPPHHHSGAEECYVISGTLVSYGRTIGPGDFLHADGDTDHDALFTETGCRVLIVVPPEDYLPGFAESLGP